MGMTIEERLTGAIAGMVTFYSDERWQRWAKLWLSERDRSAESAFAMERYLQGLGGGTGPGERNDRFGIQPPIQVETHREDHAASPSKRDSGSALFNRLSIAVAQTLASLAGTLALRKEAGQDLGDMGDTIDGAQRYVFVLIKAAIGPISPAS
jgi:hypothetical protein